MTFIPESFAARIRGRAPDEHSARPISGDDWLEKLPRLVSEHLDRWGLRVDGQVWFGDNALVLPVVRGDGPAVLKLGWPHLEADDEHLALRHWDGRGAVRLFAANPSADALLLERLDAERPLSSRPVLESCEVIGGLIRELDRPALPQFRRIEDMVQGWNEEFSTAGRAVPPRLLEQAAATLDDLLIDDVHDRAVHEDLHDANVLASSEAARGEWLAIDPKTVAGEWAYAVAPVVWNRADEAARAHNLRAHLRLRADVVGDAAGLDLDRVYGWTLVRLVVNAVRAAAYAPASDEFRGRMIAMAKAFTDPPD